MGGLLEVLAIKINVSSRWYTKYVIILELMLQARYYTFSPPTPEARPPELFHIELTTPTFDTLPWK
ncbi:hypothetical protein Anas_14539 [Armadillidium nasatum]|uniref:Uncharacterized protein n=1 Tax=Armadillidium nasatum TaxID=96803 RepID=A0A5N5T248_9CRUS|nr:hypothetical protein Anas_14539 [Armadillidium nasatum]